MIHWENRKKLKNFSALNLKKLKAATEFLLLSDNRSSKENFSYYGHSKIKTLIEAVSSTSRKKFRKNFKNIPLVSVPTSYNKVNENELSKNGFNIVIYANHLIRSAYPAMVKTAQSILKHERSKEASEKECLSIKEIKK